jgi:PAS domain S-box-containing protein
MSDTEAINVLYIEDDETQANMVSKLLSKSMCCSFNVICKEDLACSIEYLSDEKCEVDVILLDLMLPNSHGVHTFLEVHNKCPDIPIVIISGYEDIALQCITLGAQDYLVKPDISQRVLVRSLRYSIERKKLLDKSKNLEKKYRELVEVTRAAIYEIDFIQNKFTYVNEQMCKSTGWTREELLSMNPLEILTPSSRELFLERLKELEDGNFIEHSAEYELYIKSGGTRWALVTAKFKEDKDGSVVGANVVAIDITNQKLAEEEVQKKEDLIFSQLETRIHQWRNEITASTKVTRENLEVINNDIRMLDKFEAL